MPHGFPLNGEAVGGMVSGRLRPMAMRPGSLGARSGLAWPSG